jgi:hypothetical protein
MVGVLDRFDDDRTSPGWHFVGRTQESRALITALRMAGMAAAAELGEKAGAKDLLAAAMERLPKMRDMAQISRATAGRIAAETARSRS